MRQSFTAVLERNSTFTADFTTEPYEVGWATEARWFVRTLVMDGTDAAIRMNTQVSPDGLHWCDDEGPERVSEGAGMVTWPVREFGGWLRLRARLDGSQPSVKVLIYLVLKG